jgi:putative ABC transport system permease protein
MTDLQHDLRYAARTLAKHKTYTATALIALALAIGANTAIFSVVRGVLLQPLPFPASDRLVRLYGTPAERGEAMSAADVEAIRMSSPSFELITGFGVAARYLISPEGLHRVMTVDTERDFFSLLSATPAAGRTFEASDVTGAAVASHAFAQREFGSDAAALSKTIMLDGMAVTIVGVMPDSFQFPYAAASLIPGVGQSRTDVWVLREPPPGQPRRGRLAQVTGRLKSRASLAAASSELSVLFKRIEAENPDRPKGLGVRMVPLADAVVSAPLRRSLFMLFGAAALVLALACANLTNLSLIRVAMRRKDIAARIALGASRARLIRQYLCESLLLSLAGGLAGLVVAWIGTNQLLRLSIVQIPRSHELGMDWAVFAFSFLVCVASGIVFGLAPAWSAMRTDPQAILKDTATHTTMSEGQRRLCDGLIIAEVALAFVLGVGASLLIRELVRLGHMNIGMTTANVVTFHVGQTMAPNSDGRQFYDVVDRVRRVSGVLDAGFTQMLPLQSWGWFGNSLDFRLRGQPVDPNAPIYTTELRYVTPGYFSTLGIAVRRGRVFTDRDNRQGPAVIVINEALAQRAFGDQDPVGKVTTRGTIVGVIADVRQVSLGQTARPEVYYPIAQNWSQLGELGMSLVVKTDGPPARVIDRIRSSIREVNPNVAIFGIKSMDRIVTESLADFLLYLSLMFVFAGLALFLASTGAYGVVSYVAASRTREFAIRSVLGAEPRVLIRLVLMKAFTLTAMGLACGLPVVIAARPLIQNLPISVPPPNAWTAGPVALLTAIIAVAACVVPSRRAAVDPSNVLREG